MERTPEEREHSAERRQLIVELADDLGQFTFRELGQSMLPTPPRVSVPQDTLLTRKELVSATLDKATHIAKNIIKDQKMNNGARAFVCVDKTPGAALWMRWLHCDRRLSEKAAAILHAGVKADAREYNLFVENHNERFRAGTPLARISIR